MSNLVVIFIKKTVVQKHIITILEITFMGNKNQIKGAEIWIQEKKL